MTDAERKEQEDADLFKVMETESGRRFVRRMLFKLGVFDSVFKREQPQFNPEQEMWFHAALHDYGIWLLKQASRVNNPKFQLMNNEHFAARVNEATKAKTTNKESVDDDVRD